MDATDHHHQYDPGEDDNETRKEREQRKSFLPQGSETPPIITTSNPHPPIQANVLECAAMYRNILQYIAHPPAHHQGSQTQLMITSLHQTQSYHCNSVQCIRKQCKALQFHAMH